MKNIFNTIQAPRLDSNLFDLSHDVKLSFKMGQLIPTLVMDCIPGDRVKISVENFLRFAPLVSPVMHRIKVTTHVFFVPNRILWPNWEDFITGQSVIEPPYVLSNHSGTVGDLGDYLGRPTDITASTLEISAFPVAAYYKIYDEYYRDQNLITAKFVELVDGRNNGTGYETKMNSAPLNRAYMHDYFTSCLPTAQAGSAVTLPLLNNDTADVTLKGTAPFASPLVKNATSGAAANWDVSAVGGSPVGTLNNGGTAETLDPNGAWEVDINAEATTINTLRRAFRLQEFLERMMRGGKRYTEMIRAQFNVFSSDRRLQRPEYIGGTTQNMVISEVLSTAQTDTATSADNPVGMMAGHGISVGGGNSFKFNVEEHGWIIGITNVQPVTAYQQGVPRMFSRNDYLDYAWPPFANIGEQEVLLQELWAEGTITECNSTFGYIPRYAEYKYIPSRVAGQFRTTLDYWHLARKFATKPTLSEEFIECDADDDDISRIFADETGDHIYAQIFNNVHAVRKLPRFATPTI